MARPWVCFDLEGTGPDPHYDRIVEMCFVVASNGTREVVLETRVNPGRPIPPEVSEIHGIRDEDVADLPGFGAHAEQVQEIISGAVLVGYNLRRYDSMLLDRELTIAGQPGLEKDVDGVIVHPEVDPYGIWCRVEPRNLATAAKRFAGLDLEDAHAAGADAAVLPDLLRGMVEAFELEGKLGTLMELSKPEGAIDRDGKFVRREDGVAVFNFGKSRGLPAHSDPGLLRWMLGKNFFSPETLSHAARFLEEAYGE